MPISSKTKRRIVIITFVIVLPLFLLLLGYKSALLFTDLSQNQELVMNFIESPQTYESSLIDLGANANEISHLYDVKDVMAKVNIAFYILLLAISLILTFLKNKKQIKQSKQTLQRSLFYGGITSAIFPIALALFAITSFKWLFTIFHKIFFPEGNWLFAFDSFLIQTFPIEFFITIAIKLIIFTIIYASIFITVSFLLKREIKNTKD
mgnify:CR=1 FL=1|jgi:integral membrane protein (TIGR01906 family)